MAWEVGKFQQQRDRNPISPFSSGRIQEPSYCIRKGDHILHLGFVEQGWHRCTFMEKAQQSTEAFPQCLLQCTYTSEKVRVKRHLVFAHLLAKLGKSRRSVLDFMNASKTQPNVAGRLWVSETCQQHMATYLGGRHSACCHS